MCEIISVMSTSQIGNWQENIQVALNASLLEKSAKFGGHGVPF